jgi:hypothetical protein
MRTLGISLVVLGLAFLLSGLIFMLPLPSRRKQAPQKESFEESQERTAYYLQQIREERDES